MVSNVQIQGGSTGLRYERRIGGANNSLLLHISCSSNNETIITHKIVSTFVQVANTVNVAPPEPGTPGWNVIDPTCIVEEIEPVYTGHSGNIMLSDGGSGSQYRRLSNLQTEYTFVYNTIGDYQVNIHGGNKLFTYFARNNDTKIVNLLYRHQFSNAGNLVTGTNCENIVIMTGNTIWDYATRTNIYSQLFTQTYNDGSQIVTISNRTVNINVAQGHTFFVFPGPYLANLNNHFINTLNIIKPNTPDELSLNFTMILANVRNVTTTAWRNAGVRWPGGVLPISVHLPDGSGPCGQIDIYSFLNFNNLRDYYSTNTYTISVTNPSAELGLTGWTSNGNVTVRTVNPAPKAGNAYFMMGNSAFSWARQDIEIANTQLINDIDANGAIANISWWQAGAASDNDAGAIQLRFMNGANFIANTAVTRTQYDATWTYRSTERTIPIGTRKIRVELESARASGTNNDSYFDDISTINISRLWTENTAPRITPNTIQNAIWYGFEPFRRKRNSISTRTDVEILLSSLPNGRTSERMLKFEWQRYRYNKPNRPVHIICVNNTGLSNPTYADFNLPPNLFDIPYGIQPRVYFVNADYGDENDATDWFDMMDFGAEESCTGSSILLHSTEPPGTCGGGMSMFDLNNFACTDFGASYVKFRDKCTLYKVQVCGGRFSGASGQENLWISALDFTGIIGFNCVN